MPDKYKPSRRDNHLVGLAYDLIPCDKYNHRGGEGLFRITARTLSGWPPSLPNGSQVHLEEKHHLTAAPLCFLTLAGKPLTTIFNFFLLKTKDLRV
jgi:hypothetical protein